MTPQRIFGFVLLAVGVICVVLGITSSHSFADQVSNAVTGRFTQATTWYIVGGMVSGLAGLGMLVLSSRISNR